MPALSQLMESLKTKTTELLTLHKTNHPITYNHYFTETLQKVHSRKWDEGECTRIIKSFFGASSIESVHVGLGHKDLRPLVTALVNRPEPDVNRFACSEALDCMETYYQVGYFPIPLSKT